MATKSSKLSWSQTAKNVDGSPLDAAQFAGFTIVVDGAPAVSVPRAWEDDGDYEMDLVTIAALAGYGSHTITMSTVAKNGRTSAASTPLTYVVDDTRTPTSPFGLSVA